MDLTTGGAVHDMPDQRHLLGPPDAPPPPAAGRPDADETSQRVAGVHGGLASAASQVRWSHDTPGGHMTRLSLDTGSSEEQTDRNGKFDARQYTRG